jgi:alpha-ketoglutarate-dependent 2,4-dichlorophenoxyacetate dioxygenase
MDHATSTAFRYTHRWRNGDLVIWDNLATMHRGVRYDDTRYRRELRRVTTQDVPRVEPAGELMEAAASI